MSGDIYEKLESHLPAEGRLLWNQSYYFNAYDPVSRIGCFMRLGFMEELGLANTWLVFFKDGRPIFQRFNANLPCPRERPAEGVVLDGIHLKSLEPLRSARVFFSTRNFAFDLRWNVMHPLMDALAFASGGKTEGFAASMAHAHLEGSCFVEGEIILRGDERLAFKGTGARDIAAGERDWDRMDHYRVAWPIFPDNTAIIGIHGVAGGHDAYMSTRHDGERWIRITETQDVFEFATDAMTVNATSWRFTDETGRQINIKGRPLFRTFLPADTYVLAEHIGEFTRDDGTVGYGLIECGFKLPWTAA